MIIEKQGVFSNLLDLGFTTDKRLGPSIMICRMAGSLHRRLEELSKLTFINSLTNPTQKIKIN
ncbi:hypothetical protein PSHT_05243 [Puccinia striiformis]|uniref:Uncharacterized protein n=1 Tax=Puccinia striiformis TaxID=27350 RepID=A0A2S4WAX8_9BASI|nr:hypothetical protein PSHT_05243 [Puccinia striiformis]